MQIRVATVVGVLLLAISGCRVIEPEPTPRAPRIDSFTTSKTRTAPGEKVTLSFSTTGATQLELTDDSGNSLQLEGTVEAGTATVSPTHSAFYVLRATGAGGRDTAFVQIAVNAPLQELFLIAVPATIDSGEEGQLLWGAPGASTVTLTTGSAAPVALSGTTGTVLVTPATTERYTLTARGAPGTPALTALAQIRVKPVLRDVALTAPTGALPGETVTLTWSSSGAERIAIFEETLGQLAELTDSGAVASGSFDYVIPATLPNGVAITEGLPLHFTVSANAGDVTVSRAVSTVVGDLPAIQRLTVPEFVSIGGTALIEWETLNASQVTITMGGLPVFRTLAGDQAKVDHGSVSFPAPTGLTDFVLIATNDRGAMAKRTFSVRAVAPPAIGTFTLTPTLNAFGDPATARWTTTNAVRVQLRLENGATLAVFNAPSQVASGMFDLTPATSVRVAIEAFNAAGDKASEVRNVTLNRGATGVTLSPSPVLRNGTTTVTWALAPTVLETVGLATPPPAPIVNSARFIDLTTVATAQELTMLDPNSGAEKLPLPSGFQFSLLGTPRPNLYVAVDGFIAFAQPPTLVNNSDFTASGNSAPSMLAPFWDDLTMGPASKVLYALQTTSSGERFLVVQWDQLQKAGTGSSALTFQAQLFETGQVSFVYGALTNAAVNSVTVGVKDTVYPLVQQYTFDNTTTVPSEGLELNYFTGGPAAGDLTITAARSYRFEFFGRTASGLVPASVDVRTFAPGDVTVTEVMPFPESSVASTGQWVELHNTADASVDFEGLVVTSLGSLDGGAVIAPGAVVPPYGYLVVGQSNNPVDNGGAPVTEVSSDLPLSSPDSVRVSLDGTTLGSLTWDGGTMAQSLQAMDGVLVASGQTPICTRTLSQTFGPAGAIGTPGARNEACAPYVISSIPGGFVPVPSSFTGFSLTSDDDYEDATLPVPFTYFGTPYTTFSISTNGFIVFGSSLANAHYVNNDVVGTSAPNGVVAAFWDDLVPDTGTNAMWRATDRTIISWQGYRLISTTAADTHINVQIHLLDSGVIEFHYGELSTTLTTQVAIDRIAGNSATIWLERPDGALAVSHSINQLNSVAPNSGLRFTPVP